MEKWDLYDENFNLVKGAEMTREEAIPKGMFHLCAEILVRHTDGTYLLMQRYIKKDRGGMWEASAGGSALQGESPLECAKRELFEETGIRAEKLTELGKIIMIEDQTILGEFLCVTDCEKDSIKLQEGETQDYKWVTLEEILAIPKTELLTGRIQIFVKELQNR